MRTRKEWNGCYETGDLPWDTGRPDKNLLRTVSRHPVRPCRALEIGCGTGTNAVWLAEQGFEVTALDISPTAIAMAGSRAQSEHAQVEFLVADILADKTPAGPFGLVFDRGCLHSFDAPAERAAFAALVWRLLDSEGLWLSLIGSADGPEREVGPPRLSALRVAEVVEPRFEILSLEAIVFDSDAPDPPRAWACLLQRRSSGATPERTADSGSKSR